MAQDHQSLDWNRRRVVITGMGVIAPNGQDLNSFWASIRDGMSAVGPVTRFNVSQMPSKLAAEVKGFNSHRFMNAKMSRRSVLSTQYAVAASSLAVQDAKLDLPAMDPDRLGVVEGTTVSGMESVLRGHLAYNSRGIRSINPFDVINGYCGEGSSIIALALGIKGHALTYCSGCASGNDAIAYGQMMIRQDEADVMVVGATDDNLIEPMYGGFCALKIMSTRNGSPQAAMRPFDRKRDGFILGEGAAFVVLEELSHALLRGARIYAEVVGHGRSCEAYHVTDTHPDGIGFKRAMAKAIRDARILPEEVDYINAHGTATPTNDPIETKAIKAVFGGGASRLAISSTKPVTGHLMGAAGAMETVICALAIQHATVPPTINLDDPAEGCDLNYVPGRAMAWPIRCAMNLSSGFGGKNACLILKKYPPVVL
jgi:3-oxoacyl-[acyl-carrier-protein] synthase II